MRPRSPRSIRSRRTRPSSSRPRANPRRSSRSSSSPTAAGQDRAMDEARSVREFWFGRLPLCAEDLDERMAFWFGEDNLGLTAQRDEEIRARFGELFERAAAGELESWADGPRRRLSLIIVLDQFPRNMFRDSARAFDFDEQALSLALSGMQSGADAALDAVERLPEGARFTPPGPRADRN